MLSTQSRVYFSKGEVALVFVGSFQQSRLNPTRNQGVSGQPQSITSETTCQQVFETVNRGLERQDASEINTQTTGEGLQTLSKFADGSRLLTLKDAQTGKLTKAIYEESTTDSSGFQKQSTLCSITCKKVAEEAVSSGGFLSRLAASILHRGEGPKQTDVVEYHRSNQSQSPKGDFSTSSSLTQQVAVGGNQVIGLNIAYQQTDWALGRAAETPPMEASYRGPGVVDLAGEAKRQSLLDQVWLLAPGT